MNQLVLRIPDVAARLGMTPNAVRHLIERKTLPSRKLGGRVVVLPDELDQFVRELPARGKRG